MSESIDRSDLPQVPAENPAPAIWPSPDSSPAPPTVPLAPVQTSSNAIVALVLAIAAWPLCPVIFAIIALVFASKGSKEIAASGGRIGGEGFITAARIVAWINIGFYGALLLLGLMFVIIFAIAGGL